LKLRISPQTDARPSDAIHLPVSALNVGSDDRNDAFLTPEVGATELMFRLLPKYLKELSNPSYICMSLETE